MRNHTMPTLQEETMNKMRANDMSRKKPNAVFALTVVALDVGGAVVSRLLG